MTYEAVGSHMQGRPGQKFQQWLAARLVRRFLADASDEVRVLEIGTGLGWVAEQIIRSGHQYVGVEPTTTLRNAALQRLSQSSLSTPILDCSLPSLTGVQRDSFTHVIASHVLEHASNSSEALAWLEAMRNCLAPNGKLLIVCPNYMDLRRWFFDVDRTHQWVSTTSRIVSLGEELGLRIVEQKDLRCTASSVWAKAPLALLSHAFPTGMINQVSNRLLGVRSLGTGIQTALFWRMSWVVFRVD